MEIQEIIRNYYPSPGCLKSLKSLYGFTCNLGPINCIYILTIYTDF